MGACASTESSSNGTSTNNNNEKSSGKLPVLYVLLAFIAAVISTLIALFNIYKHLRNYTRPEFQKSLIRILFIVPVYAIFSWLSLAIPAKSLIFESIRDIWEAVVIYEFLKLILAYCGGESACLLVIMKHPGSIDHMWPLNYCLPPMRLDARFMRICKRFTLQFVLIKPVMAIVNIVMLELCMYNNKAYQISQLVIYNISYSVSLYALVLFYLATHYHPSLLSRRPLLKFLAIKTIVFATYYQGLIVQFIPGFDRHYLESLNNFIFCWEMIIFSLIHIWAFGWFEFVGGSVEDGISMPDTEMGIAGGGIGLGGPAHSVSLALRHDNLMNKGAAGFGKGDTFQINAKDAFNMGDVVGDALENFNQKYEDHVRLDTSEQPSVHLDDEDDPDSQNPFQAISPAVTDSQHISASVVSSGQTSSNRRDQKSPSNPFQDDLVTI